MITLAKSGDTVAAREIVELLGDLVLESKGSATSNGPRFPEAAASYLAEALANIAGGMDADLAFNLKSTDRLPDWPDEAKVLAVSIMSQCIENHSTIDDAAAEASAAVNQYVGALRKRLEAYELAKEAGKEATIDPKDLVSPWQVFIGKEPLDIETLEPMKSWYTESLNSKQSE
jgi:hypothetical protein